MRPVAVLVTHGPDLAELKINLAALAPQVAGLVLVDDGSGPEIQAALAPLLARAVGDLPHRAILQPENLGLARAQNAGVAAARDMGAGAVVLADQDSRAAPDMVAVLLRALAARRGDRPAGVGVDYDEPLRGLAAPVPDAGDVPEMEAVIASGSLIPLRALDAIGPFDETLFIDFVDTEWCFRARAAGWGCFAARGARMTHRIGDRSLRIAGRARAVHAPFRMYYQIRNLLLLARRPATPSGWIRRQLPRYLARSLVLSLAEPPRGARFRAVLCGIGHGLAGLSGARHPR